MKLITKKKQRECILRLKAIRKITDDMNYRANADSDTKAWADNMEYLADNLCEIAYIVNGIGGMCAIADLGATR